MIRVQMEPLPAYILAGGQGTRFGSDKARAVFQGEALIVRQARFFESLGHRVIVVAHTAGEYDDLGLTTIADIEPDQGPAAGLLAALRHRGEGWLILSSCDMVILQPYWLDSLRLVAGEKDVSAVAFFADYWQPFPGLYHTRLLNEPQVWRKLSLQHVLRTAGARALPMPADWPVLVQANTPEDLRRLAQPEESP